MVTQECNFTEPEVGPWCILGTSHERRSPKLPRKPKERAKRGFGRTALTMADLGLVELHSVDPKGVVLRTVPEYLAGGTQIESLEAVIRDAVRHGEVNPIWSIHALTQELAQIARAHERAEILLGAHGPGGFVGAGGRPYSDPPAKEPGLARVVGGQRLQEALGDTVEILGPHW